MELDLGPLRSRLTFSADEARSLDLGREALRELTTKGVIRRLSRGWYTARPIGTPEEEHRLRVAAVMRGFGEGVAASHHSMLLLVGLPVVRADLDTVFLTRTDTAHGRSGPGVHVVRKAGSVEAHSPEDGTAPIPHVDPATAIVQAGLRAGLDTAVVAADAALRAKMCTRLQIDDALDAHSRCRGHASLRPLATRIDPRRESPGESLCAGVMTRAGYAFTPQVEIRCGIELYRVDFLLDALPVIVEFDGMAKYGDDLRNLREEKRREDNLRALGYEIVRLTWTDLFAPERFLQRLAAAVARATARRAPFDAPA